MNKTSVAPSPVIFQRRFGQRDVPGKIYVPRLQPVKPSESNLHEHFTQRECTISKGNLALRVQAFKLIKNV
jgi:hypothetical protein